jgi:hypothetical protein
MIDTQRVAFHQIGIQLNAALTPTQADKVIPLHEENTQQVHAAMQEIMAMAQEQLQVPILKRKL